MSTTDFTPYLYQTLDVLTASARISKPGLVALGGSHAYGLATNDSDVDVRGFAFPTASDVLLGRDFEQIQTQTDLDLCVYSLAKTCKLVTDANPNMVELLGLDETSVLRSCPEYEVMCAHPEWFLSRRIAHTFGGYATAQLRRLQNAMARDADATRLAEGAMRSMQACLDALPDRYPGLAPTTTFSLDLSDEDKPRVLVSLTAHDAPASELSSFARELDSARKSAETIGKNRRKESSKLAKHASHLLRLLHMGAEILEGQGVHTRRIDDNTLLREVKAGKWLSEDKNGVRSYDDAFWQLLDESQTRFAYAEANTALPEKPDRESLDDFLAGCHRAIVADSR